MTGTSTTDHIPVPKSLEHFPFSVPPEEAAIIINDGSKLLTIVADPMYAVQWAKSVSMALLDQDKFTPSEGIAKSDQIAEVLLSERPDIKKLYPCKNAKGEIVQMNIIEAFFVVPGKEAAAVELGRFWMQEVLDAHAANVPSKPPTKLNGAAPVNSFPTDEPTGLDDPAVIAALVEQQKQAKANAAKGEKFKPWGKYESKLLPEKRKPLKGGTYSPDEALKLLNSHYLIGKTEQEIAIFRIKDDGSLAFTPPEQFRLDTANIFVRLSSGSDKPAEKFWRESSRRLERKIVFKPGGTTEPDEFNLWRGFGVKPRRGWQKQRRLLRHILKVICRGDKAKFKYLMRWLAWAVQNPDKHPGTINMLKSRKQGTGKSTLGVVMLKIFGPHGALIADKERLLGKFNDWLEDKCFIVAEEILWAGDHKTADQIKSLITGNTIRIERKFGGSKEIPNRLHTMMMTNHDHAVAAGVGDRRNVVYDISDERACDKTWFDPIYQDLDDGSASEFLYFLQNVKLGEWHPRQILKTAEAVEQQRMTGDSICQWSQACIYADAIVGAGRGPYGLEQTYHLGTSISTEVLKNAYTGYCRQHGQRAANEEVFGKACAEMFGPRKRLKAQDKSANARRPWGYDVPDGDKWQEKLDARLGIKK